MNTSSIQNIFQQSNPYEQFVQQLVQLESRQKLQLQAQQEEHRERKTALGDVSSAISTFISRLDELGSPTNNAFEPMSFESSDESVVRIDSAAGVDDESSYNIQVDRMARNDIALSGLITGNDSTLAADGDGAMTITIGDQTETISVETTKEDDEGQVVDKTNQEILESFAGAISEAFGDSVRANVFDIDGENVQLSVQSLETGYDNRIQFGEDATGVLESITDGMTHVVPQEDLNARFTIDGVTFERSENTVSDAIDGLTFTLTGESDAAVQMSVERDVDAARENIDDFIKDFNEMNRIIRSRTFVDGDNNSRGPLRGMRSIRGLTLNMRQTGLLSMDGAEPGQISRLAEIGISFQNNGNMTIDDSDMLNEALRERPEEVAELFRSEDSPIATMKEQAESFTKSGGVIAALEDGVDQTLDRLDRRISQQERYLEQFEEQQRQMFNELQQIIERGQSQFQEVMAFRGGMGI